MTPLSVVIKVDSRESLPRMYSRLVCNVIIIFQDYVGCQHLIKSSTSVYCHMHISQFVVFTSEIKVTERRGRVNRPLQLYVNLIFRRLVFKYQTAHCPRSLTSEIRSIV